MEKISCPICGGESSEFVVDLNICEKCSHIFKKEIVAVKGSQITDLHFYVNPLESLRWFGEVKTGISEFMFKFPNMVLYPMDLHPNDFYKHQYNHYFNQMSLNILFDRSGFKVIEQKNVWNGDMCMTEISIEKEVLKND